ncbi:hypothetical protein B0H21DRAFT_158386 [Amylocystis lapponica]|nr:hypothetical protein B0H21DRAFT_158386 [Amylocystis lapponica]
MPIRVSRRGMRSAGTTCVAQAPRESRVRHPLTARFRRGGLVCACTLPQSGDGYTARQRSPSCRVPPNPLGSGRFRRGVQDQQRHPAFCAIMRPPARGRMGRPAYVRTAQARTSAACVQRHAFWSYLCSGAPRLLGRAPTRHVHPRAACCMFVVLRCEIVGLITRAQRSVPIMDPYYLPTQTYLASCRFRAAYAQLKEDRQIAAECHWPPMQSSFYQQSFMPWLSILCEVHPFREMSAIFCAAAGSATCTSRLQNGCCCR